MVDDCIFCKIIKGEIPCSKIYENDDVLAFLDINPVNPGHAIIIPKDHHVTLLDIPNEILAKTITAVKIVAEAVIKGSSAQGFNMMMNNYETAGQVVMHAHIHIVPRFSDDGLKLWPGKKYNDGEMDLVKEKIIGQLKK